MFEPPAFCRESPALARLMYVVNAACLHGVTSAGRYALYLLQRQEKAAEALPERRWLLIYARR